MVTCIEVESANGTREVGISTRHLMNRRIFIQGEINEETANNFVQQIMYLESEGNEPISVYINSNGGSVSDGLLIYDAMQASKCKINTICTGMAASMGAVILCGGSKGHRYILPHSKVMIHEPLIRNGVGGSATSISKISESILDTRETLNGILAKHTGKTIEEMNEATAFDNYFNAEEAIEFGLVDKEAKGLFV